jgi:flagellar motility protein MotE (MotC chaperone)
MIRLQPSLLMLTAVAAALSTVAHGLGAAAPTAPPVVPATRLGVSIQQDAATRDQAAAAAARALELREQVGKATEARLKADLDAREKATTAGKADAAEGGDQYETLARIYQAMKPAKAAVVFEALDMDVQMQVAKHMRERAMAMILAGMTPKGATELSMALARKDAALPKPTPAKAP